MQIKQFSYVKKYSQRTLSADDLNVCILNGTAPMKISLCKGMKIIYTIVCN